MAWSPRAPAASAVLESVDVGEANGEWKVRVSFGAPMRYLRHTPEREGGLVEIALEAVGRGEVLALLAQEPDALHAPQGPGPPLRDLRLELGADGRPTLLVRFWEPVAFGIEPGADFRSLVLRVRKRRTRAPGAAKVDGAGSPDAIMAEARAAMVARQYDRAIALYTLVLRAPAEQAEPHAREALEYLGLARQRNGQAAHARAEYEAYLVRFPEGEGSDRVRQRLAAMDTATSSTRVRLRPVTPRARSEFDLYGSVYTAYFRTQSFAQLGGVELVDSSQHLDGDVNARYRRGALDLRARAAGYLRYDFDESDAAVPSRVTRLYLEARDRSHRLGATLGRQSSRGGGVLGRLDGLTAEWGFLPNWTVKGVAGFPFYSSVQSSVDTSRQVYGLSVESRDWVEGLSTELYTVGQFVDGTTDRAALGLETRYVNERGSAYGLLDFDFHFAQLNIATFSGSWRVTDETTLNATVDYRYSPILLTSSALIGQPFDDLDALEASIGSDAVDELVVDRTPRVTTFVAGVAHRITDRLEANGDFTASQIGATRGSTGLPGIEASDWFFYYTAQLVSWDWLMAGGSERVALRFFDGDRYDAFSANLSGRYRLPYELRLTPELRFEYRMNRETADFVELDPGLRVEYRFRRLVLDLDFVFQWIQGLGSVDPATAPDELGYLLNAGVRYDF